VPETPSVSCDLRVFVDHAADRIAPAGSERVKVDDGPGQWSEWCGLSEGAVPPVIVMVGLVLPQHAQEMLLVPDQGAVKELPPASADPPLHDRVGTGAWTGLVRIRMRVAWKTSSKAAVNFVSRSRVRNLIVLAWPPGSISRFRACWVTHLPVGWAVLPRMPIHLVACSTTART
jgi:hypothetical protein